MAASEMEQLLAASFSLPPLPEHYRSRVKDWRLVSLRNLLSVSFRIPTYRTSASPDSTSGYSAEYRSPKNISSTIDADAYNNLSRNIPPSAV